MFQTSHYSGFGRDEENRVKQQTLSYLINDAESSKNEPRLHMVCQATKKEEYSLIDHSWRWTDIKKQMIKEIKKNNNTNIISTSTTIQLPHAILSSTSKLHEFFKHVPIGLLQMNNIKITSEENSDNDSNHRTFQNNAELSDYLNTFTRNNDDKSHTNTIRISGDLCGDLLYLIRKTLSKISFSFKARISKSTIDPLDYFVSLRPKFENDQEGDTELEKLSKAREREPRKVSRPHSFERWLKDREEQILRNSQPDIAADWRKKERWVAMKLSQLSGNEKVILEQEYDAVIARYDASDLALKERYSNAVRNDNPGINTVMMEVDDESLIIHADYVLTSNDIYPMIGTFSSDGSGYTQDVIGIVFKVDPSQAKDYTEQHIDIKDILLYHSPPHQHANTTTERPDPRSRLLRQFSNTGLLEYEAVAITLKLGNFIEVVELLCLDIPGDCKILPVVEVNHLLYIATLEYRDGELRSASIEHEFDLRFTWINDNIPPYLLKYRDTAESYILDPSVIPDEIPGSVERWRARKGPFKGDLIFRLRHLPSGESQSEACLGVLCRSGSTEYAIEPAFNIHPLISPYIFDILKQYDGDAQRQRKAANEAKNSNNDSNNSIRNDSIPVKPTSLMSVIAQYLPALAFSNARGANAVIQTRIGLGDVKDGDRSTNATRIHADVIIGGFNAVLSLGGYGDGGLRIQIKSNEKIEESKTKESTSSSEPSATDEDEVIEEEVQEDDGEDDNEEEDQRLSSSSSSASLSLAELLHICNLDHIISDIPEILLNRAKLHECKLGVSNPDSIIHTELHVHARTGTGNMDHFILMKGSFIISQDPHGNNPTRSNIAVMKLNDSSLINSQHIPALASYQNVKAFHCFTYLATANANDVVHVNTSLNYGLKNHYAIPDGALFPEERRSFPPKPNQVPLIVPHGAHYFTIKQQKHHIWTSANQPTIMTATDDVSADDGSLSKKVKVATDTIVKNSGTLFDIPLALIFSSSSSTHLAQYVFSWLDINSILFGLRYINRATYGAVLLKDNIWWKNKLSSDYGRHIVRWDVNVLIEWRSRWLAAKPILRAYQQFKKGTISLSESQLCAIKAEPIWYSVAIYLQIRLNKWTHDIMKAKQHLSLPHAIELLILSTPPFQLSVHYVKSHYEFKPNSPTSYSQDLSLSEEHEQLHWFGIRDGEEHTRCLALYSGPCYVIADEHTKNMGVAADDDQDDDSQDNEEENDNDNDEVQKEPAEELPSSSVKSVREITFTDPNYFPILEWEPYQSSLWMADKNSYAFAQTEGMFRYVNAVHKMWDKRAEAMLNGTESSTVLPDEDDLNNDEDDEDDAEKAEDVNADGESDDGTKRKKGTDGWGRQYPRPLTSKDSTFDLKRLRPSFEVKFDASRMRSLVSYQLQEEIHTDQ